MGKIQMIFFTPNAKLTRTKLPKLSVSFKGGLGPQSCESIGMMGSSQGCIEGTGPLLLGACLLGKPDEGERIQEEDIKRFNLSSVLGEKISPHPFIPFIN